MRAAKNMDERTKMVEAMEFICRQINDEEVFNTWLAIGVADGDIDYGCFDPKDENARSYAEDDSEFSELMTAFLYRMIRAAQSGGLYCDGVVAESAVAVEFSEKGDA